MKGIWFTIPIFTVALIVCGLLLFGCSSDTNADDTRISVDPGFTLLAYTDTDSDGNEVTKETNVQYSIDASAGILFIKSADNETTMSGWDVSTHHLLDMIVSQAGTKLNKSVVTKIKVADFTVIPAWSFGNSWITEFESDSVEQFRNHVFNGCSSLTKVIVGDGSRTVSFPSANCFAECSELKTVRTCGEADCVYDVHLVCPSGSINVASGTFSSCTSIESVYIEKNTGLATSVFQGCTALVSYNSDTPGVADLSGAKAVESWAFARTKIIGVINLNLAQYETELKTIKLGDAAFRECSNLEYVSPIATGTPGLIDLSEVHHLGGSCFYGALKYNNTILDLKDVEDIYNSSFEGCTGLTKVQNCNKLKTISYAVFRGCTNLSSFNANSVVDLTGIDSIEGDAFKNCSMITDVNLKNVNKLGGSAFGSCGELKEVSNLGVETIGVSAFQLCGKLSSIKGLNGDADLLGVKYIGNNAFEKCSSLVSFGLPDVETIGSMAFSQCTQLDRINCTAAGVCIFPCGLTSIGTAAFDGTRITQYHIPSTVTNLGNKSLYGDPSSRTVEVFFHSISNITSMGSQLARFSKIHADISSDEFEDRYRSLICWNQVGDYIQEASSQLALSLQATEDTYTLCGPTTSDGKSWVSGLRVIDNGKIILPYLYGVDSQGHSDSYVKCKFGVGSSSPLLYESKADGYLGLILTMKDDNGDAAQSASTVTIHTPYEENTGVGAIEPCIYIYNGVYDSDGIASGSKLSYYLLKDSIDVEIPTDDGYTVYGTQMVAWSYGSRFTFRVFAASGASDYRYIGTAVRNTLYLPVDSSGSTQIRTITIGYWETGFTRDATLPTIDVVFHDWDSTVTPYVKKITWGDALGDSPTDLRGMNFHTSRDGYRSDVSGAYGWYNGSGDAYDPTTKVRTQMDYYIRWLIPESYEIDIIYRDTSTPWGTINVEGPYTIDVGSNGVISYSYQSSNGETTRGEWSRSVTGFSFVSYTQTTRSVAKLDQSPVTGAEGIVGNLELQLNVVETQRHVVFYTSYVNDDQKTVETDITRFFQVLDDGTAVFEGEGDGVDEIVLTYTQIGSGLSIDPPVTPVNGLALSTVKYTIDDKTDSINIRNGTVTLLNSFFGNSSSQMKIVFSYVAGYTIAFAYGNDGDNSVTEQYDNVISADDGSVLYYADRSVKRAGYEFEGWSVNGVDYANPLNITNKALIDLAGSSAENSIITITARWNALSNTVSFESDGGVFTNSDGSESQSLTGVFITDDRKLYKDAGITDPKRVGYTFSGWTITIVKATTGADTETISVAKGGTVTISSSFLKGYSTGDSIVATAIWTPNEYTVVYDLNGATDGYLSLPEGSKEKYTLGETLHLPAKGTVTRPYYTFQGWYINGDDRTYDSGDSIAVTVESGMAAIGDDNDLKLTFKMLWAAQSYTIQFNENGGIVSSSASLPNQIRGGFEYPLTESERASLNVGNVLTFEGYSFGGWAFGTTDKDTAYDLKSIDAYVIRHADASNVVTMYAKWEPQRYHISYNLDGGALGENSPTIVYSGVEFSISVPSKTGYSFDGWTSPKEGDGALGSGAKYRLGDSLVTWKAGDMINASAYIDLTYETEGTVSLTANWTPIRYTVSYDLNGGEGTIPASQYPITVGSMFAADSGSGLSRTGYTFGGWSIDGVTPISRTTSGQMSLTNAMAATADDANVITLQAVWSPNIYRVHVIESPDSDYYLTASYGESVDLGTPSRVFYTFNGWSLNPASGEIRSSDAKYSTSGGLWVSWPSGTGAVNARYAMDLATSETITVEASWTAVTYYINYDLNNGRGSTSSASATIHASDTRISFPSSVSRSGYDLKGWSINGTTVLESTDIRTMVSNADATGTVTLIAVWTPTNYTVHVVEVSGSVEYDVPAVYGESVSLGIPTRSSYTFTGWRIVPASGETRSDDARYSTSGTGQWIPWAANALANAGYVMDISLTSTITVQAVWEAKPITIEYDLNGGTGSTSSAASTVRITDTSVNLPTGTQVTRAGYTLRGWSVNGSTVLAATDVRTMVANADGNDIVTLKALWNSNSYTIHVTETDTLSYDVTAVYGESVYLGTPTRTYYTFSGWSIPVGQARSDDARYSVSGGSLWIPWPNGASAVNAGYVMDLATTGTINVQATWTAVTYYIDYDLGGGTGSTSRASTTVRITDSSVTFPASTAVTRGGYTLGGWSVNGVTVLRNTDVPTIVRAVDTNDTVTLKAVWNSNSYTVHVVESDSVQYDVSAVYDESVNLGIPTRAYYTFAGWSIPAGQTRSSDARYSVSGDGWIPWPAGTSAVNAGYAIDLAYSGTVTVQATWTADTYHIEYDLNGGKGSTDGASTTVKVTDPSVTFPSTSVTRDGYTLRGWSVNGATVLDATDVRSIVGAADDTDIVKLIAVWGSNTYTVHVVEVKDSIEYDVSAVYGEAVSLGIPTRAYYTFAGWNIVPATGEIQSGDARYSTSGSGQWIPWPTDGTYVNAGYVTDLALSSTIHVEAVWNAKSIYIEYDYNGGRGNTDGASATVRITDEKVVLPNATQVTRQGYALNGWSLNGTVVLADTDVSSIVRGADENDTVTLHAVWSTLDYTIRYRTLETDDYVTVSATFDAALNLGTPTRQWYVFEGWLSIDVSTDTARYSQDGTNWMPWPTTEGTAVNGGYVMNLTSVAGGTVTLDAVWTPQDIYIEYNLNNGTGSTEQASSSVRITDERMTLPTAGQVSREGYALMGWSLNGVTTIGEADVQTVVRASGSDGTVTLIAMWSTVDYSVRYRALDTDEYITVSATFDVPLNIGMPTRQGYTFAGWVSSDVSSGAARYSSDGSFWIPWPSQGIAARGGYVIDLTGTEGDTVTLDATWDLLMVNVDYDLNGGTGEVSGGSAQVHLGMEDFEFAQPGTAYRAGYAFSGWSLDKETVLAGFTDRMVLEADSNNRITLYAVWTANAYYIEYRSTEDAVYVRTQVYYDVSVEIGTPERIGYSFLGWSSSDVDKGQSRFSTNDVIWQEWPSEGNAYGGYVKNLSTVASGVVHLTAVWDKTVYTVTYDANGSSAVPPVDSATYTLDDPFALASVSSLQGTNGKRIATGWALDQTATTGITVSSFVASLAQAADSFNNVTLYAVWIEGKYAVMVDIGDAKPSIVPTGWTLNSDGLYQREADYGSLTKDVLSDWDDTSFDWEGHKFTAWRYDISSVITDVTVTADFEEVHQWYLYAFVGVIIVIAIIAFAVTRLERW